MVNFDLPNVLEDYVHRIGRTGRVGAEGEAVSLVCMGEHQLLRDIERLIKRPIPQEVIGAGFEPDPNAKPAPIQHRSQGRSGLREGAPRREGQSRGNAEARRGNGNDGGELRHDGAGRGASQGESRGDGRPANGSANGQPSREAAPAKTGIVKT